MEKFAHAYYLLVCRRPNRKHGTGHHLNRSEKSEASDQIFAGPDRSRLDATRRHESSWSSQMVVRAKRRPMRLRGKSRRRSSQKKFTRLFSKEHKNRSEVFPPILPMAWSVIQLERRVKSMVENPKLQNKASCDFMRFPITPWMALGSVSLDAVTSYTMSVSNWLPRIKLSGNVEPVVV